MFILLIIPTTKAALRGWDTENHVGKAKNVKGKQYTYFSILSA